MDLKRSVVYQIYPRSFCDKNGDGFGDINGIISRLGYLKDLGVNVIWLSPIYLSSDFDNGYDIDDYYTVDPRYGSLDDCKRMFSEAKKLGIKIIMDLVINHTSSNHMWFKEAIKSKDNPYHDYYIFKDKPNNWDSLFSGSSWEYVSDLDEYYLHLFTKNQPDLNIQNKKVRDEVKNICKFWLDLGCSGFRCDVINVIYKTSLENGKKRFVQTGREHYLNQDGCIEFLKELRRDVISKYDAFLVGETVDCDIKDLKKLTVDALDLIFVFKHLQIDTINNPVFRIKFKPKKLKKVLDYLQEELTYNANFFECHDQIRSVDRFGSLEFHNKSAKALATILLSLRGTPFIYQGEEIGMTNGKFNSLDEIDDCSTHMIWEFAQKIHFPKRLATKLLINQTRDHARLNFQWDESDNGGFSTSNKCFYKSNYNYKEINVSNQINDEDSILSYYKKLIKLRLNDDVLINGSYVSIKTNKNVIGFIRKFDDKKYLILSNLSKKTIKVKNIEIKNVIISNYNDFDPINFNKLRCYESVVLEIL